MKQATAKISQEGGEGNDWEHQPTIQTNTAFRTCKYGHYILSEIGHNKTQWFNFCRNRFSYNRMLNFHYLRGIMDNLYYILFTYLYHLKFLQ